jgi:RNA polymerase sigma-70 factor (ECF subfamily)
MTTTLRFWQRPAEIESVGDIDWDAVYAEEMPRIYNYFWYRLGDSAVAEDLTATTFEKAWRARARYRSKRAAFSTWLHTIARNVAADYFRRHHTTQSLDELAAHAAAQTPAETAEQRDESARLTWLLAKLPARERELLALKYGAGLNNRQIARLTSLSESNVGTVLNRVTSKLRLMWEPSSGASI